MCAPNSILEAPSKLVKHTTPTRRVNSFFSPGFSHGSETSESWGPEGHVHQALKHVHSFTKKMMFTHGRLPSTNWLCNGTQSKHSAGSQCSAAHLGWFLPEEKSAEPENRTQGESEDGYSPKGKVTVVWGCGRWALLNYQFDHAFPKTMSNRVSETLLQWTKADVSLRTTTTDRRPVLVFQSWVPYMFLSYKAQGA